MFGDMNGSGEVDATDALAVLQAATGKISLDEIQRDAADTNGDGKLDANDALLILQYTTKKIAAFPAEIGEQP